MANIWTDTTTFVEKTTGMTPALQAKILATIITLVALLVLRRLIAIITSRRIKEVSRKYILLKVTNYLLGLLAVGVLVNIWVGGLAGLATYAGILSAGLAIALQDPLVNFVGSIYIFIRKPFTTGDRIQIGDHAGDVIDISLFQFTLVEIGNWVNADQSTGRIIHVPNGWVFKYTTCNYTQGFNFIWNEVPVTITFESNWEKAREILSQIAREHSAVKSEQAAKEIRRAAGRFLIFYQHLEPVVWTSVAGNGVTLTIRYICTPRDRRSSAGEIWEDILRQFAEHDDVDLAYPTTRVFRNNEEGKDGTQPDPSRLPPTRVYGSSPPPQQQ